jgi:tetratricopeptide (TPR) repeat protein
VHRLTRPPQKFAAKGAKPEQSESYAVVFFRENPDIAPDKRPPTDKLEEIDSRLSRDLEEADRFKLLVHKRSLSFLAFGENSPESLNALLALGAFYNQQNRHESAVRHLTKAQQISKVVEMSETDSFTLAVELADAQLSCKPGSRPDTAKPISAAEATIAPFVETKCDNRMITYKRDLLLARIAARRNKYDDAREYFDRAIDELSEANHGENTQATAALYAEIGECAEAARDSETAGKMFAKAHAIYIDLDMAESAALLAPKLPNALRTDSDDDDPRRRSRSQRSDPVDD